MPHCRSVAWFGSQSTSAPILPPFAFQVFDEDRLERRTEGIVAGADVDRRALAERVAAADAIALPWKRSEGRIRQTVFLSCSDVICGALPVGVITITLFGIVTACAIAMVEVLDIVPMITLTLSTLISFVAASIAGCVEDWSSCESTILDRDLLVELVGLQRGVDGVDREPRGRVDGQDLPPTGRR